LENLKKMLAAHPFLAGLQPAQIDMLAQCATAVQFRPHEEILREGEEARHLYLLRHGRVAVELLAHRRGAITVQTLGEGEVLGWSWLVEPQCWHFSARAVELTRAVALEVPCVLKLCESHPEVGYQIMKRMANVLAKQIRSLKMQLVDFYGA